MGPKPPTHTMDLQNADQWQSGPFDCMDDVGVCCWGCFCFPCQYGAQSGIMFDPKSGGTSGCFVQTLMAAFCPCITITCCAPGRRNKLRIEANRNGSPLPEKPCNDCLIW